ncbi:MAG: hypothetical protein QNL70_09110 [Pseudomonas sp.]|uniref:Uncharacterized protein n=1 Tax=SAR86 cluster bacterium TaxID=2030880 RepID=A0A972VXH5_9GAMM|nr:hypothetical protein [SAR86 cluster bacterium]
MTDRDRDIQAHLDGESRLSSIDDDVRLYQSIYEELASAPPEKVLPDDFSDQIMARVRAIDAAEAVSEDMALVNPGIKSLMVSLLAVIIGTMAAATLVYGFSQAYQLSFDSAGAMNLVTVVVGLIPAGLPVIYGLAAGALVIWLDKGLRSLFPVWTGSR